MRDSVKPLVIIPTYNERENLCQLIPEILGTDNRLHVLIVDDDSPDNTAAAVFAMKENSYGPRLSLESRPSKLGLGSAYIRGFRWGLAAGYDFLIQMDGDWSHSPRYLEKMLQLSRGADFVVGSRYVAGGGTCNWGVGRRWLSKFGNWYARLILGARMADLTGGFNGWQCDVLRMIDLSDVRSDGYSFQIEMKYRACQLGYKPIEFPILFDERRAGQSKMSAAIAFEACWRVLAFRLRQGAMVRRPPAS